MSRIAKSVAITALAGAALLGSGGLAAADAGAEAAAIGSPGVLSGNIIQRPTHIPINLCGNTVNSGLALLNPAFGNTCANVSGTDQARADHSRAGYGK